MERARQVANVLQDGDAIGRIERVVEEGQPARIRGSISNPRVDPPRGRVGLAHALDNQIHAEQVDLREPKAGKTDLRGAGPATDVQDAFPGARPECLFEKSCELVVPPVFRRCFSVDDVRTSDHGSFSVFDDPGRPDRRAPAGRHARESAANLRKPRTKRGIHHANCDRLLHLGQSKTLLRCRESRRTGGKAARSLLFSICSVSGSEHFLVPTTNLRRRRIIIAAVTLTVTITGQTPAPAARNTASRLRLQRYDREGRQRPGRATRRRILTRESGLRNVQTDVRWRADADTDGRFRFTEVDPEPTSSSCCPIRTGCWRLATCSAWRRGGEVTTLVRLSTKTSCTAGSSAARRAVPSRPRRPSASPRSVRTGGR